MLKCCKPWSDLVEFSVVWWGSHMFAGYWHELGGHGILYCHVLDSMYIDNCGTFTLS